VAAAKASETRMNSFRQAATFCELMKEQMEEMENGADTELVARIAVFLHDGKMPVKDEKHLFESDEQEPHYVSLSISFGLVVIRKKTFYSR
jgi:hypothetical protein